MSDLDTVNRAHRTVVTPVICNIATRLKVVNKRRPVFQNLYAQ